MSQGQSTYDKPMDEKAPPVQSLELPTVASMTNEAAVLDAERRYRARRKRRAHVFIALGLLAVFWYSRRSESAKPIPRQFVEMRELLPAPQVPSGWPYEGEQTYSECHNAGAIAVKDADGTFSAQKNFPAAISTDYGVHSFELIPVLDYKGTVTVSAEQCLGDPPIPSYLYSVNFTMKHPSLDALDLINMCAVHTSSDGSRGVVLGPTWPSIGQVSGPFEVHVDIRIPSCIPSLMSSLKMNLPGLNHTFKALETELKSVQVLSSDSYIANEGLRVRDFEVSARNSPITGFFNVTNGLSLTTSNAPIDVAVEARHEASHWPSDIRIQTSNAELNASLSLINSTTHGNFRVFTTTSNGPTDVTILTSPIDGKLRLDARTSNAPARLAVDPAFEGVYVTHLANAQGIVSVREDVEDPMGLGRARVIETKVQIPTMIMGSAYWGSSKKEDFPNIASIKTSNNVATIVL